MKTNPADYKAQRELRGAQASVAALLGVNRVTIARRETGEQVITARSFVAASKFLEMAKTETRLAAEVLAKHILPVA